MTRVFITGDTHSTIDWEKLNTTRFPVQKDLTKEDLVIIAGDFGGIWDGSKSDDYVLNTYDSRNFTTLFVDGNHENFDLLNSYPVEEFHGGKVHRIRDSVYHLMRGQVYDFGGKSFFTFGGARSTDRIYRKEGVSWWPQEIPNEEEMKEAEENLAKVDNKVNYVITHCCPKAALFDLSRYGFYESDKVNTFLDHLISDQNLQFDKWFFGHYHEDLRFGPWNMLYQTIEEIDLS